MRRSKAVRTGLPGSFCGQTDLDKVVNGVASLSLGAEGVKWIHCFVFYHRYTFYKLQTEESKIVKVQSFYLNSITASLETRCPRQGQDQTRAKHEHE